MPKEKTMADKRTIISMPEELRERVRSYRFSKQINTEAEAIRTLIEKGLEAEGHKASKGEGA
jgi:predicted DNA-binding protein